MSEPKIHEVILPRIDPDMEEGIISKWYIKEGEKVKKGEPLYALETEKVTYDVEAPVGGILKKILVSEGTKVSVGTVVALIEEVEE